MKFGLIGAGISGSRMPALQKHLARMAGFELDYVLIDSAGMAGFDPVAKLSEIRRENWRGANITHPYKKVVHGAVNKSILAGHKKIGSYNTIKFTDDEMLGANTDYSGFKRAYRTYFSGESPGRVLICGAGGVGHAIAFGVADLGAREINIYDIDQASSENLRLELAVTGLDVLTVAKDGLVDAMRRADGLANCTTLGMPSYPGSAFPVEGFGAQKWAFDAVYTPVRTEFLFHCKTRDLACLSGFDLWINQGIDAFNIFTDQHLPLDNQLLNEISGWFASA